ncbi:hypothetical protein D3C81_1233940 [compost metagenome]
MQNLRLIVIDLADAVPAILAHDAETFFLRERLDRMADIPQRRARFHHTNTRAHRLVSGFDQMLRLRCCLADHVHAAGITKPAILDHRDVEVDDVAILQRRARRNAVADHIVDRGTDGFRKTVIANVGRHCFLHIDDVVVAQLIELISGDASLHMRHQHRQHFSGEFAGSTRLGDVGRGVDLDLVSHALTAS